MGATDREAQRPQALPVQPDAIPAELRAVPRWVLWAWHYDSKRGKWTKPPYRAADGRNARSTGPDSWASFADALAAYRRGQTCHTEPLPSPAAGIGLVLTTDDDLAGIDLDHCVDRETGEVDPWARKIVGQLASYTEVSPSGTGLRVVVRAKLPPGGRKRGNVEAYETGRYLTITGHHVPDTPASVERRREAVAAFHAAHLGEREPAPAAVAGNGHVGYTPTDGDVLAKVRGAANGARFAALYAGDDLDYPSPSEADAALCGMLAFYTREREQIRRIVAGSGRGRRAKWARDDYAWPTIDGAIALCTEHYEWPVEASPGAAGADAAVVYSPSDPLRNARLFVDRRRRADDGSPLLLCHRDNFYTWNGACWPETEEASLRADLYRMLEHAVYQAGKGERERFKPNKTKIAHVLDALRAAAHLSATVAAPAWLNGDASVPASEVIPCANGLLHWPTRNLLPHTPQLFVHHQVRFDYDPQAAEPVRWLAFLDELWPDDPEAISTLQEMFGYLLSGATDQQKIFLLVGPKRSGKGTIARVLAGMVGRHNVAGPTLASLITNFGLQPLIDTPVAVVSDARLSGRADQQALVERLLSISGEDTLTVDRKHRSSWTGKLPTRFMLLTNELPRLADGSGALASRFVVLTLQRSFYGRENTALTDRLLEELPSILNWALDGLERLRARGRFAQPQSSDDAVRELEDLGSPIGAFVRDRCVIGPDATTPVDDLYHTWRRWCEDHGRDHPGTAQSFGRDLRAAVPGIKVVQPRGLDGKRRRYYAGVRLRGPQEPETTLARVPARDVARDPGVQNRRSDRVARDGTHSSPLGEKTSDPPSIEERTAMGWSACHRVPGPPPPPAWSTGSGPPTTSPRTLQPSRAKPVAETRSPAYAAVASTHHARDRTPLRKPVAPVRVAVRSPSATDPVNPVKEQTHDEPRHRQ